MVAVADGGGVADAAIVFVGVVYGAVATEGGIVVCRCGYCCAA